MKLWTFSHAATLIPSIAAMLLTAAILRRLIGDKPLKIRMIPFQILACAAVVLEAGKQIASFSQGYDLYHIPLHFCSLFIFMLPAMAFCRSRHRELISGITAATSAALFSLMLIYPNLIYSEDNINCFFGGFFDFHTVAFHNIVMFEFILILFLRLHTPDKKRDTKAAMIFTACFCAVSASMAQLLKTNFANFYTCNIPVLETLRRSMTDVIGAGLTQVLYVLIVASLHILFVMLSSRLYQFLDHLLNAERKSNI